MCIRDRLSKNISPKFNNYRDVILIIDDKEKEVSSSVGHGLMNDNPFSKVRFNAANNNITKLLEILASGNLNDFCELIEGEALMLHSLMMNSNPSYILMKPETLEVIERIQDFRENSEIPVCFTLDAGANVHVLFPENFSKEVMTFIEKELASMCKGGRFITDFIGEGPKQF